jgi:hypothetical protein
MRQVAVSDVFVTAGAGFLLAVLWFDLMFDVQVLRGRGGVPPERSLASIAAYYRRVTTEARRMSLLGGHRDGGHAGGDRRADRERRGPGLGRVGVTRPGRRAILTAVSHTFPAARRLGARRDPAPVQLHLARVVLRDHLFCLAAIGTVLTIQLAFVA